ncbi:hypothetical protein OHD62_15905 [Mesorhizobium sp. YC-39]|uniref:hypothetical protein n=1 Tax=unclassified Mesorhizobium TaxID=325217 RepID=UPI0021E83303|nr:MULTISPECIES: hypothetical protein [unclassified Mesorhizobium]MCV3208127.1 hypothetical protein [Mesorhizobium sp. YC-2]MCV3229854.1 hypothetical protein [Mesorhizobium sp. YC-39]
MLRLLMAAAPQQHRRGSATALRSLQAFTGATRLVFGTWRLSLGAPFIENSVDGEKSHGL